MRPEKRSLTLDGHRTSVTLERPFWEALKALADAQGRSVNALAAEVDRRRTQEDPAAPLAGALRVALFEAACGVAGAGWQRQAAGALVKGAARGSRLGADAPDPATPSDRRDGAPAPLKDDAQG